MSEMTYDRKKLLALTLAILAVLLLLLFLPYDYSRIATALVLCVAALAVYKLVQKRSIHSHNKRQVLLLMSVIAVLYLALYYLTGLSFGFAVARAPLSWNTALLHLIPSILIIIATEIIRTVLLAQEEKAASVLSYFLCLIAQLLLGGGIVGVTSLYRLMDIVGLTVVPALSANLLYHYIAKRFGALPNIVYRLVTTVYIYFITVDSAMSDALLSLINMILPAVIYLFISMLFEKKMRKASKRRSVGGYVGMAAMLVVVISVVMLISCQFRFRMLVIATPSMEGELNVGDAVIFEHNDAISIKENDIIVFANDGGSTIVHRVVDIQNINGEIRYFTKGDANPELDTGYVTRSSILGVVRIKLASLGYPSLMLRDIFE